MYFSLLGGAFIKDLHRHMCPIHIGTAALGMKSCLPRVVR